MHRIAAIAGLLLIVGCQSAYKPQVAAAIKKAGDNAPQLRAVLDHYRQLGDEQKLAAAEFLIANMGPHGFVEAALFDGDGNEVPYNSLDYDNFDQAMAAREQLDKQYEGLKLKRKQFVRDVETITADYLIDNIEQAFDAWRTHPWAADVTFDAFCNYILPYRGSNEPLGNWRTICRAALAEKLAGVDPTDKRAISKLCNSQERAWVRFDTKCYLHPTDQSFEQMRATGLGRCEDLSNMQLYLNRANGLPIASDYTPAWARANNNHAWTVVLDGDGQAYPRKNPMNGAAKVYRKMYAQQRDLPVFNAKRKETIPGWLALANYRDVTREYRDVHDMTVQLREPIPDASSFAYLCVFNSGRWVPIAWGRIDRPTQTAYFPDLGGNIAYMPAFYAGKKLVPAAPVHILDDDGGIRILNAPVDDDSRRIAAALRQTKDVDISPDTGKPIPAIRVEPGHAYELFYWDNDWVSLGKKDAGDEAMRYDNLPNGRLYRLRQLDGRDEERPFTIEDDKQVLW